MNLFLTLLLKLAPLYLIISSGFILARIYPINSETLARVLIYIAAPVVVFNGIYKAHLSTATLSLPLLFFIVGTIICYLFYQLAKQIWPGAEKNLIAFTSGTANSGYFGLPVAIGIFGDSIIPYAVLISLGTVFYENTFGLFILGKGKFSSKGSIKHLLKLPNLYACALGLGANLLQLHFGNNYNMLVTNIQGSFVVLGMLLIGLSIPRLSEIDFDSKFTLLAFGAKFFAWPLFIWLSIKLINALLPNFYPTVTQQVFLVLSIVPLATNTVVYSSVLHLHPQKAALTVFLSTLWALLYIPLMLQFLL